MLRWHETWNTTRNILDILLYFNLGFTQLSHLVNIVRIWLKLHGFCDFWSGVNEGASRDALITGPLDPPFFLQIQGSVNIKVNIHCCSDRPPDNLSCCLDVLGLSLDYDPNSKVHGANMGPTWGRQDPGGPHVDPMNIAIWGLYQMESDSSGIERPKL